MPLNLLLGENRNIFYSSRHCAKQIEWWNQKEGKTKAVRVLTPNEIYNSQIGFQDLFVYLFAAYFKMVQLTSDPEKGTWLCFPTSCSHFHFPSSSPTTLLISVLQQLGNSKGRLWPEQLKAQC